MGLLKVFTLLFNKIPEGYVKNELRYFLMFNKLVPKRISSFAPMNGYLKYFQPEEGDIVIDAGAYPGDYSIYAARRVGKTGKVVCFEPDIKGYNKLIKIAKKAKVNNIIILQKGLWCENKKVEMSSVTTMDNNQSDNNTLVELVKLDDELKRLNIKKVNILKMDIEGAEIQAIKGCKNILLSNEVKVSIASYHIVNNEKTSVFIEQYLSDLDYKVITEYPSHLTTYAWKNKKK